MLVLSRMRNEEIVIETPHGDVITIMVINIRGDKVQLGCKADMGFIIHRREVFEAIKAKQSLSPQAFDVKRNQ